MSDTTMLARLIKPSDQPLRYYGVSIGIVTNLQDPQSLGRVRLKLPWLGDTFETNWARVTTPFAGPGRGFAMPPEVGTEVLVTFEHGDPDYPFVIGSLWNGQEKPPPVWRNGKVTHRSITTRAGHTVEFQEDDGPNKGHLKITSAGGQTVLLDDRNKQVTIKSEQHTITLDDQGHALKIESGGDLTLSGANCTLKFSQSGIELGFAGSKLTIAATGVELAAQATLDVKANAALTIQGSVVKIN